jgi:ABC-type sugar transport system substrate-binding protein
LTGSNKVIELILDKHPVDETEYWKSAARMQAGLDRAKIKVTFLGEPGISPYQADLVREVVARRPPVVVVEPADPSDPKLAEAVREVRDAGISVVLLGRPLASTEPAAATKADTKPAAKAGASPGQDQSTQTSAGSRRPAPLVVVTPPSFAPTSKQLVASAIRITKNMGADPNAGTVVLYEAKADLFVEKRLTAMRDALKAAGITKVKEIRFEGDNKVAEKALTDFLNANPTFVMIFALDHQGFVANRQVANALKEKRPLVSAGYTWDDHLANMAQYGEFAAIAEYVPIRLIRKATSTAIAMAQGKEMPSQVEIPLVVHDSPENAGVNKFQGKPKDIPARVE